GADGLAGGLADGAAVPGAVPGRPGLARAVVRKAPAARRPAPAGAAGGDGAAAGGRDHRDRAGERPDEGRWRRGAGRGGDGVRPALPDAGAVAAPAGRGPSCRGAAAPGRMTRRVDQKRRVIFTISASMSMPCWVPTPLVYAPPNSRRSRIRTRLTPTATVT